jgi:hypothetical protein
MLKFNFLQPFIPKKKSRSSPNSLTHTHIDIRFQEDEGKWSLIGTIGNCNPESSEGTIVLENLKSR